jgi:hypothetical protein
MEPGAQEGEFAVCVMQETPPRETHIALVVRADVLIEVLAFPEAGLDKKDVLDVAASIPKAE